MGAIFIGGGGGKEHAASLDKAYKSTVLDATDLVTCLYIPHAMEQEKHQVAYDWFVDCYNFFHDVTLLKSNDDVGMSYSSIYLGGGYCHKLRDTLQALSMDATFFRDFLKRGGTIYGGSAGGVVLGRTLLSSREVMLYPDNFLALNQEGFNICSGLSFRPHYTGSESEKSLLEHLSLNQQIGIIALGDQSGIIFRDDEAYTIVNPEHTLQVGL